MNYLKEQLVLGILRSKISQKGSVAFFKLKSTLINGLVH